MIRGIVFQEMVKIIPAFFESLMTALGPLAKDFSNFGTTPFNETIQNPNEPTLASFTQQQEPTYISHENYVDPIPTVQTSQYSQAIFRAMSLEELIKGINSGRFTGSDLSLARHVLDERQTTALDTTTTPTQPTADQIAFQQHRTILVNLQIAWVKSATLYVQARDKLIEIGSNPLHIATKSLMTTQKLVNWSELYNLTSKIRHISQDYNNPIETDVRELIYQLQCSSEV